MSESKFIIENEILALIDKYKQSQVDEPPFDWTELHTEIIVELERILILLRERKQTMSDNNKPWIDNTPKDEWGSMKNNKKIPDWNAPQKPLSPNKQNRIDNLKNKIRGDQ